MAAGNLLLCGALALLAWCQGSHVVTTPRKWTVGEAVQVCVFEAGQDGAAKEGPSQVSVTLLDRNEEKVLVSEKTIRIPEGETEMCDRVFVPHTSATEGKLKVVGNILGQEVNYVKRITLSTSSTKIFVQTDKLVYKPGQDVQFRILTLNGPFLKISSEDYSMVYVETPSASRIAQWTDVDNSAGLVHLSMKLADEPEEGTYTIVVRQSPESPSERQYFKVEEYVLPRFEVTVTPPKLVLGTDEEFLVNVCAKYTYGQPVKGNITLEADNNGWGSSKIKHVMHDKISGCKEMKITADDIQMNGDNYYVYRVSFKATVVEEGTGVELTGSADAEIQRAALQFTSIGKEEFVKPNLPFSGKFQVNFVDGSPAPDEPMEVCLGGACTNLTTDAHGVLEFISPTYSSDSVMIKSVNYRRVKSPTSSWRSIMYASEYQHYPKLYYSPTNSSLVIHAPEGKLPCVNNGETHTLPVMFSAVNETSVKLTVQVISRGQIQYSKTEVFELSSGNLPINEAHLLSPLPPPPRDTFRGTLNVPVSFPRTASPEAKVVVWYSRKDGEVVSDAQKLDIKRCLENDVKLSWSVARVQPGEKASLTLQAEPQSVCSLGVVDKSVELLSKAGGKDSLTLEKIFTLVEKAMISEWENTQTNDYEYCRKYHEKNGPSDLPGPPGGRIPEPIPLPANLDGVGRVERSSPMWRPYYSNHVDALKMFDKSGIYILTDLTTETRPCQSHGHGFDGGFSGFAMMGGIPGSNRRGGPVLDSPPVVAFAAVDNIERHDEVTVVEQESVQRTYFPETWLWKLFPTLDASGKLTEEYTLPDTITEWVGRAVCVNFQKGVGISHRAAITTFTPFFVDLTLPPSVKRGEILPVKISVFNYMEQDLPVKVVLEESPEYEILGVEGGARSLCIPAQDKVVHTVKIRARALGDVNMTIDAFVDELYPDVCGPEFVVSKRDILIKPIKVEAEGFPREKTWTKYICSKDLEENSDSLEQWSVEVPSDVVEGSARGWVTAVGDLLGPTLENLGSLVKMPYGCGEQNMLNFAPNIFILQYLDASNQTTQAIAEKAIDFMKQGYQRELKYRHDDGSFSAFGNSDASGSTWLTAFVLKSFAQARQYVMVDENDLEMSRDWLKRQQMENGCFESVGKVFHKGMKGGIAGSSSPAPLTAYVLISLLESGEAATSSAVTEAHFCLKADTSKDPYTVVLKAYALALSGVPEAKAAMQALISLATETSNSMYWELPTGASKSEAVAVETAGYALLAMMTLDAAKYENQARKIVKWISAQRNGQGGFVSTQDTVVALQALASFEAHQEKTGVDVVIAVEGPGLDHAFFIDETNKLLQQQTAIPSFPTTVLVDMSGQGCALVQAVLRYNIPKPTASDAFALSVSSETAADTTCVTKRIKGCASYLLDDQKSNMAVVEFDLISGYIPHKADLKQIVGYGTGLLKRYEVDGSKVMFYVDEFSPEELCIEFRVTREVDVEDTKPGSVKVYDYYQPEYSISQSYVLPPNDECILELIPNESIAIALEDDIIVASADYEEDPVGDLVAALDGIP